MFCKAFRHVEETTKNVQHICDNVDSFHSQWWGIANSKTHDVGAEEGRIPQCCKGQRNRENVPSGDPSDYYK